MFFRFDCRTKTACVHVGLTDDISPYHDGSVDQEKAKYHGKAKTKHLRLALEPINSGANVCGCMHIG